MEIPINPQTQEKRSTANAKCHVRRKRQEWDEKRLGYNGIHHAAPQTPAPAASAQNAAPLLDILSHTVTSPP